MSTYKFYNERRSIEIIRYIAEKHGVRVVEILSQNKLRDIVFARQEAMAVIDKRFSLGSIEIGRIFNRDHTTVLYGIKAHWKREEVANKLLINKLKKGKKLGKKK